MTKKNKIEPVSKESEKPTISLEGWDADDENLADLLEKTAEFLRNSDSKTVSDIEGADIQFKEVETGDLFVVSHRS